MVRYSQHRLPGLTFRVNARLVLLGLLAIRASLDATQAVNLVSIGSRAEINVAAVLGLSIVLFGVFYSFANRINPLSNPISIAYAAFLFIGFTGIPFSAYPMAALADWLRGASLLVIFTLIYHLFPGKERARQVLWAIGLSSIIPILTGTFQFVTLGGVTVQGFNRAYGTFVVPPIYASYLVLLLPLAAVLLANSRSNRDRAALAVWLVFLAINLFATYTRGAWMGAGLALLILATLSYRKLLVVLPVVALLAIAAIPQIGERFSDLARVEAEVSQAEPNSMAWRIALWRDSVLSVDNGNVLVGAGLGSIREAISEDAHNDYLRLYVETGALGLISYLVVLGAMARAAWQSWRREEEPLYQGICLAFLASFAAYVVMSFTDNIVLKPVLQWYFWSLAAVTIAIRREKFHRLEGRPNNSEAAAPSVDSKHFDVGRRAAPQPSNKGC